MPNWTQLVLPAVEKLAASPKSEQGWQIMQRLSEAALPAAKAETPWQKLIRMAPKEVDKRGFGMIPNQPRGKGEHVLDLFIEQPGKSSWGGTLTQSKNNPFEAYLQYLGSGATRRSTTGASPLGHEEFKMDISSPAQRNLPFRQKLSAEEKAARPPREPEQREKGWKYPPQPSFRDKQAAFDKLADLLRRSGHREMSFVAEPGERPRLYEMLTGYKAQPTKRPETDVMSDMLRRFPGRQQAPVDPAAVRSPSELVPPPGYYVSDARPGAVRPFERISDIEYEPIWATEPIPPPTTETYRAVRHLRGEPPIRSRLRGPAGGEVRPIESARGARQRVMQGPMHVNSLENALGLSADEAVEYGLARRLGTSQLYEMTDQGRAAAAEWGTR